MFKLKLKENRNIFVVIFLVISVLIPFIIMSTSFYLDENDIEKKANNYESYSENDLPKVQGLTKDQTLATKILELDQNPVGEINLTEFLFDKPGIYNYTYFFNEEDEKVDYNNDLLSGALNISYVRTKFIKTLQTAKFEKLNEEIMGAYSIEVQFNETISVEYDESLYPSLLGYFVYLPILGQVDIEQLWIENDTLELIEVGEENYTIEEFGEKEILKFFYKNYFNENSVNFTLHLICEFNLTIDSWQLIQKTTPELLITDEDMVGSRYIVSPRYLYSFNVIGNKYAKSTTIVEEEDPIYVLPTDNLWVNLTIHPTDKNLLISHTLNINDTIITEAFLNPDKSIYTNLIRTSNNPIKIEFNAEFSIEFVDRVDETWAIDRLVEDQDIRERIYFPKIISGPSNIILKYVKILEETVSFDQVISSTSLFNRPVLYVEINVSEYEKDLKNSLIFHEFATKKQGIKITLPYMLKGETCPVIIKYETSNDLMIIVTDNIGMPLWNYEVRLYYYGEKFGTYISKDETQPLGPLITDENGEILIKDVPNGNYTAKIFPRESDNILKEAEVSAFLDINYVKTNIIHFPLLILIFGGITGIILILGLKVYLKHEKSRSN